VFNWDLFLFLKRKAVTHLVDQSTDTPPKKTVVTLQDRRCRKVQSNPI